MKLGVFSILCYWKPLIDGNVIRLHMPLILVPMATNVCQLETLVNSYILKFNKVDLHCHLINIYSD